MVVKPHRNIQDHLAEWRLSLAADAAERTRLAKQFWAEFVAGIVAAGGPPPGSVPASEIGTEFWWCAFPPCYHALVWFREVGRVWGLWASREAVVIELNFSPGLSG